MTFLCNAVLKLREKKENSQCFNVITLASAAWTKSLTLAITFQPFKIRAFTFHMYIPCDKIFQFTQYHKF